MKKIIKPILLLGSICCLVGCGKDSLPFIDADYATARGKTLRMLDQISNLTLEDVEHKQIKYVIHSTENGEILGSEMYATEESIYQIDLEKHVYETCSHYLTKVDGISTTDNDYCYGEYYDSEVGIVAYMKFWMGNFYTVLKTNAQIEAIVADSTYSYESVEEYVDQYFYDTYLNVGESTYLKMDALYDVADYSEYELTHDYYSATELEYYFKLNTDALEMGFKYNSDHTGYTPFGYGKILNNGEEQYHYFGLVCESWSRSGKTVITDGEDNSVLFSMVNKAEGSSEYKTSLNNPTVADCFELSNAEFNEVAY